MTICHHDGIESTSHRDLNFSIAICTKVVRCLLTRKFTKPHLLELTDLVGESETIGCHGNRVQPWDGAKRSYRKVNTHTLTLYSLQHTLTQTYTHTLTQTVNQGNVKVVMLPLPVSTNFGVLLRYFGTDRGLGKS